MCNPYEPPNQENPPEENDTDSDWIYRETFGYTILLVVLFYLVHLFMNIIKQICQQIVENFKIIFEKI